MIILGLFFIFLHKNICWGYSLEAPHRVAFGYSLELPHQGTFDEYHNICFYGELEKIIPELSPNTSLNPCPAEPGYTLH